MKTADDWRQEYYCTRGRMIPPCSFLDDVLRDMEELEASVRFLQARLLAEEPELTAKDVEV